METPFENCPFSLVWKAFKNLYPDKKCICYFDYIKTIEDGSPIYGETCFNDDGTVYVLVDVNLKLSDAIEIFAHELAHVAVGSDANHGEEWEKAFDAIFTEYNKLGDELFI